MTIIFNSYVSKNNTSFLKEKLLSFPEPIQNIIKKYVTETDRNARIVSKLLLLECMSYFFSNEKIDLELLLKTGKQACKNFSVNFNSSHSEDLVVVACSQTSQIGIDIEFKKNINIEIFSDFLHINEQKFIETEINKKSLFYSLWTKKEALIKSSRIGINADFKTIDCTKDKTSFDNQIYFFKEILLDAEYSCYTASTEKIENFNSKEFVFNYNNHFS